jgi:hypothetical protein
VFTDRQERIRNVPARRRWFTTTRDDEAAALARADVVLAIQEDEAAYFRGLTSRYVVTVGHVADRAKQAGEPAGPPSVVMVSSSNPINLHGLSVFLERTWPLVLDEVPEARFRLVGKICDIATTPWPGLERLGFIEHTDFAYEQGHVVLNPVLEGTGLPTKSVEAMLHGKALVTTPCGARGITDGAGSAFLVGETSRDLARCLVRLLVDTQARKELSAAALRYAQRYNRRQVQNLELAVSAPASWHAGRRIPTSGQR